ncbi:MAG: rhodanese-like domain-containing protein [Thermoanaerobaculum sp.]
MGRIWREAAILLAVVVVFGTVANLLPHRHMAWWGQGQEPPQAGRDFQLLDADSAYVMGESLPRTVFVDTRTAAEFNAGHIPGALRLELPSLQEMLTPELRSALAAAQAVIIYGGSAETDIEQLLAQALRRELPALPVPYVLAGGIAAWQAAGFPLEAQP